MCQDSGESFIREHQAKDKGDNGGKIDYVVYGLHERIKRLEELVGKSCARIEMDALYKPAVVASFLSCGKTNVYELLNSGELARTRIGAGISGVRVKGSDIAAFIDSRREGGPQPRGTFKYLKLPS